MLSFDEFIAKKDNLNELTGTPMPATTPATRQEPYFDLASKMGTVRTSNRRNLDRFTGGASNYGNRKQELATAFSVIEDILDTNIQSKGEAGQRENEVIINQMKQFLTKYSQHNRGLEIN